MSQPMLTGVGVSTRNALVTRIALIHAFRCVRWSLKVMVPCD